VLSTLIRKISFSVFLAAIIFVPAAQSQNFETGMPPMQGMPANKKVPQLEGVGIDQKLDTQLPLNLPFTDENGQPVQLSRYFGKRPVVLAFVYYNCPMMCPEVLAGMADVFKQTSLKIGKDYEVVTVSFNPKETPLMAAASKAEWTARMGDPEAKNGWHFLTGSEDSIEKLTDAAGFRYKWDPATQQYNHATAIMVVTPQGRLSKYFYGVVYSARDLRLGLVQASENKIGTAVDAILLFCCRYNAVTGKYDLLVSRLLSIGGALTIVVLGTLLLVLIRHDPTRIAH
jgi:protein SCO1/2